MASGKDKSIMVSLAQCCFLLFLAYGLRNERHFCAEASSQARSTLQLFDGSAAKDTIALFERQGCEARPQARLLPR
jgi:hypothetical protein